MRIANPHQRGIDIPQGVTTIRRGAFYGCDNLESVTIRGNITSVAYEAFGFCTNLKYISCYAESVPNLDSEAMHHCTQIIDLYVRSGLDYSSWESVYPKFLIYYNLPASAK